MENATSKKLSFSKAERIAINNDLKPHFAAICDILKIKPPYMEISDCLLKDAKRPRQINFEEHKGEMINFQNCIGGFYDPDTNKVDIPCAFLKCDFSNFSARPERLVFPDILYALAHELKHAEQVISHPEYYQVTYLDAFQDPAEIDADAFAINYILSSQTPYDYADIPHALHELQLATHFDGYKRFRNAKAISKEYDFENIDKIKEFKSLKKSDYTSVLINILDAERKKAPLY